MGAETTVTTEFDKLQEAVVGHKPENEEPDIKFGIGMSQDWDPYRAGVQAASKALEQVNYKPKFLLIFSTIHYSKGKGGFKALLKGCRDLVKDDIRSVGGTIAGFICPEGCFTRGIVVIAASGNDINFVADYAKNIRLNSRSKGKTLCKKLKDKHPAEGNELLLDFCTGPIEPELFTNPVITRLIDKIPHKISKILISFVSEIASLLGDGPAFEVDTLEGISESWPSSSLFGFSTTDDNRVLNAYTFFDYDFYKNSMVLAKMTCKSEIHLDEKVSIESTNKKFKIGRGWRGYYVNELDGEPFKQKYLSIMGWPANYPLEHVGQIGLSSFYYPIGFRRSDGLVLATPVGMFLGQTMATNQKFISEDVELFRTNVHSILKDYSDMLEEIASRKPALTIIAEGLYFTGVFGSNFYKLKELIDKKIGGSPYLVVVSCGEHFKPSEGRVRFNDFSRPMFSVLTR